MELGFSYVSTSKRAFADRADKAMDGENNPAEKEESAEGGSIEMDSFNEGGDDTNRDLTIMRDATYYYDEGGADD